MRILPLLTALLVAGALWLLVLERPLVMSIAHAPEGPVARIAAAVSGPRPDEAAAQPAAEGAAPAFPAEGPAPTAAGLAPAPAPAEAGPRRIPVVAVESRARPVEAGVLLRGRSEATRRVEVRAETTGPVISEPLRKGSAVAAGAVLCALDPGTRPATLAEAEARRAEAELNLRAAEQLGQEGFASGTRIAAARAAFRAAEAAVAAAQRELERTTIRAPFAGLLETDTAETGSLLQPGALCATVVQLDPIRLVGFLPEAQIERVAEGLPAAARLVTGHALEGRVSFVARSAEPATRTFRVEVEVPNPGLAVREGQTAEILIAAPGAPAHLLPASALTLDDDGRLGLRLAEGPAEAAVARFVPVTLLRDSPEGVFVTGLPDRARVIVIGQDYVTDGTPLAVTLREAAP